jgi:sugar/nucleoside kinase (ribokinase family)
MPGTENSARDVRPAQAGAPRILCAGIIVLDEVFYVENLPPPDGKVEAKEFFIVNGGCAANAAVTVARLGGRATLAGPMGSDANGDFVLAALAREKVDCAACQRVPGLATALSAIFIDARATAADIVLADNRYPVFVGPICAAARRRGLRIVLDADKRTVVDDPLLRIATHVVFSSECLIATAGCADLAEGLRRVARHTDSFLAVSNGPNDILFLEESLLRRVPVFAIRAVDTLGAGDALHGGFALALAEGRGEAAALRFAAAVAGLKCTRLGGSAGLPTRAEVDAFMAQYDREAAGRRGEAGSRPA